MLKYPQNLAPQQPPSPESTVDKRSPGLPSEASKNKRKRSPSQDSHLGVDTPSKRQRPEDCQLQGKDTLDPPLEPSHHNDPPLEPSHHNDPPLEPSHHNNPPNGTLNKRPDDALDHLPHDPPTDPPHDPSHHIPNETVNPLEPFDSSNPVAYWAATSEWPKSWKMAETNKGAESLISSGKRKSSSQHTSQKLETLSKHGVFLQGGGSFSKEAQELCHDLLMGDETPKLFPCFPPGQVERVLQRVAFLNESRIRRDVLPWVVPSAENLYLSGEITQSFIGDELDADWFKCAPIGSTRPKPDYVAGLLASAFTSTEIAKLTNYSTAERPFLFTHNLAFPFLVSEAKSADFGLARANVQNNHSASIAVKAIFELYKSAFGRAHVRVQELYDQALVFSVSYNGNKANIFAHYACPASQYDSGLAFYGQEIGLYSFALDGGADRYKTFNFVHNLYTKFADKHLKRIKDAVAFLPEPGQRVEPSFNPYDVRSDEMLVQDEDEDALTTSQEAGGFRRPGEPASAKLKKEVAQGREQINRLLLQLQEQSDQMKQDRFESKEREARMMQESKEREARMMQESKEREDRMSQQIQSLISMLQAGGNQQNRGGTS